MSKFVRVMDGLKSNASGKEFKLDEVVVADTWNPLKKKPEEMGGFNFTTEDKILRYIFRGDTIYDVIIPKDAEVVLCDSKNVPNGIYRANKIIVTNPRLITEDMATSLYKKSTLPITTYFQCLYCLLFKGYINTSKYIIKDIVNEDNVNEAIEEFENFARNSHDNISSVFEYDKLFPEAKEIYDILKEIQNPLYINLYIDRKPYIKNITNDKVINITGESGSGKTFLTNKYMNNDDYVVIDTDIIFNEYEVNDDLIRKLRNIFKGKPKDYLFTNFDEFYLKILDYFKDTNKIVVIDSAQYRNIKDYSILRGKIIVMRTCVNTCYQRCLERWSSNNQYNEEEYQKYVNKKKNIFNWYHSLNKFIENIDKM